MNRRARIHFRKKSKLSAIRLQRDWIFAWINRLVWSILAVSVCVIRRVNFARKKSRPWKSNKDLLKDTERRNVVPDLERNIEKRKTVSKHFFFENYFKYNFFGSACREETPFFSNKNYIIYKVSTFLSLGVPTVYVWKMAVLLARNPTRAKLLRRTVSYSKLFSCSLIVCFIYKITLDVARFDLVNLSRKLLY